jgi:uncharacterized membrane protein
MYTLALTFLLFFIYAFLGRVHETVYFLITKRAFKTTSFLRMPILPIYGVGAIAIDLLVSPYIGNPFLVFAVSVAIVTVVEYIGHLLIEKIFHVELWNYDNVRWNIQGRVSLHSSLGFGALALLVVYVLHPLFTSLLIMVPPTILMIIALVLFILVLVDFANSVGSLAGIRFSKLRGSLDDIQEGIKQRLMMVRLPESELSIRLRRSRAIILKIHRANIRRIRRAFPDARLKPVKTRKAKKS